MSRLFRKRRSYLFFGIGVGLTLFPLVRKRVKNIDEIKPKIDQVLKTFKETIDSLGSKSKKASSKSEPVLYENLIDFESDEESPKYIV